MVIVIYRKFFYAFTGIVLVAAIGSLLFFGLNLGIDFTGGTLIEARYESVEPDHLAIETAFESVGIESPSVRSSEGGAVIIRTEALSSEQREVLPAVLSLQGEYPVTVERFSEVGPTIGHELRSKALWAILAVIIAIVLYVAFVFRAVSRPISSWWYGLLAIIALVHDVIVPVGLFAALGFYFGAQVDTLFVMALLAILGYSVNDTIVVFDRVRENLARNKEKGRKEDFQLVVGRSLDEAFTRSVNTSLTTLLVLLALFFLGPVATQDFALVLIVGVIAGTYSSIALATPLLVTVERWKTK